MRDPGGPLVGSPGQRRRISGRLPRDPASSGAARAASAPVLPGAAGSHGTSAGIG
jgi:hypothetical protein